MGKKVGQPKEIHLSHDEHRLMGNWKTNAAVASTHFLIFWFRLLCCLLLKWYLALLPFAFGQELKQVKASPIIFSKNIALQMQLKEFTYSHTTTDRGTKQENRTSRQLHQDLTKRTTR